MHGTTQQDRAAPSVMAGTGAPAAAPSVEAARRQASARTIRRLDRAAGAADGPGLVTRKEPS
jgi:hypothetical protein